MTFDSTKTVKPRAKQNPALTSRPSLQRQVAVAPPVQVRAQVALAAQYTRPVVEQRRVAAPALHAMTLHRQEEQRLDLERQPLQRQAAALSASLPDHAIPQALQRQVEQHRAIQAPAQPQGAGDWVTLMRAHAQSIEQKNTTIGLNTREINQLTSLQRQTAQALSQGLRQDRGPAQERYDRYAGHLLRLQRHPLTSLIPLAVMRQVPLSERPSLQRALDEATRAEALQRQQDERALQLHSIQRQLAELDEQATLPVMQRIQERRGAGNPLPAAIQRHLEQGLNHDLSRVRIHDDAEADKLSKAVKATAFTTGTDIYFQSGQFNPNTQSGLELLAHEVTHTVQQSKGQVGKGIDPDAGLENEARAMGAKLAHLPATPKLVPPAHVGGPHAPGVYTHKAAVQRAQDGASSYFALKPLYDLQPQSVQRAAGDDLSIQRDFLGIPTSKADVLAKASGILKAIPGYEPLCLAFGKDLVTGQTFGAQGEGLLEKLADWAPGPLKDIIKALKETNVIGKAWEWFKGELGKLELGSVLSDIKNAIFKLPPDFGAAKDAIVRRVSGLKNLILGSARRIAEIGLTALTAGLGPIGQQIMAGLRSASDSIIKILKDPVAFARNLIEAVKGGFKQFASNAPKNLGQVIGGWLGSNTGIEFPSKFDLPGILMTALSVMGLTYQAMRGRLVKALGPGGNEKVSKAETTVQALQTMRTGLHKADEMKSEGGSVSGEISEGIKSEVTQSVVMAGIQKLVTMLIPGGGFINAIIGAFQTVQTIVQQAANIGSLIVNGLSSIAAIAAGNIGSAVGSIERALVSGLSLALTWLTKVLGLGNLAGKIKNIIGKVKGKLDKVLDKIVAKVKGIIEKLMGKGKDKGKDDSQDTADSKQVKSDVRTYLSSNLPKTFKSPVEISNVLQAAYSKFSPKGLKALKVKRSGSNFTVQAKASPYENVGITTEDILFDLDDIELMTKRRGVALKAKINGIEIESSTNTPSKDGVSKHAEENFVSNAKKILSGMPNSGVGASVIVQLSSSPCGDPGGDAALERKLHDCASTLINFAKGSRINLKVQILGLYSPNISGAKALSKDGIKRMLEAGIRVETWTPDEAIKQIESKYGDLEPAAEGAIKSKLRNAIKALESISRINLGK